MLTPANYFFIISGTLGLLLTLSLIVRSRKSKAPLASLSVLVAVMSIELFTNFATGSGYVSRPDAIPFWLLGTYLLVPPSLLIVTRHSVGMRPLKRYLVWLMYISAAVEFISESLPFMFPSAGDLLLTITLSAPWFWFTEIIPVVAVIVILFWWAWQLYNRMRKEGRFLRIPAKVGAVLAYYALVSALWFLEAALGITLFGLTEILLGMALFVISCDVFIRAGFFEKLSLAGSRPAATWKYNDEESLARLRHLFHNGKFHLQSRFSLDELASALELPPRYVSYLIGRHFNTNFAGLINRLRVEAVIDKLRDPSERHKTILALAYESGFNSKSTFNQVFKSHTGMSPSQYLKYCNNGQVSR